MPGPSRFPHLALPFTLVGAAAGWLSAGLFENPAIVRVKPAPQLAVTVLAAAMAGLTGALLTRLCAGGPESRLRDDASSPARPPSDVWRNHVAAVLVAGTLTGGLASVLFDAYHGPAIAAVGGLACAAAFLPVCLAVLGAARRAQRARLGSLVAASDRRAVWGILATALSVTTLGALPSWAAAAAGDVPSQLPVALMLAASALGIAGILAADLRSARRARQTLSPDVIAKEASEIASSDTATPRLDLGLGDDLAARVARPSSAYRGRDRAVALILGNPGLALSALRRAVRRGAVGLALVAVAAGLHVVADSGPARMAYDADRCEAFDSKACSRVADRVRLLAPEKAAELYSKACSRSSVESCVLAANMYESRAAGSMAFGEPLPGDPRAGGHATEMLRRACRYGDRGACVRVPR